MNMRPGNSSSLFRVAGVVLALAATCSAVAKDELKSGDSFPDLTGIKFEGKLPDDLKGKTLLVDFWASWCAPCAQSFPVMEELHQRYKDQGFAIIAISVDENSAPLKAFLKKHPVSFTVVRDVESKLVSIANVEAMPTSFLVDSTGKVRFIHSGFHGEQTRKQYLQEIESLLKH